MYSLWADRILKEVSMPEVIERYHVVDTHGHTGGRTSSGTSCRTNCRTNCPFHGGKDNNLSYNNEVYYCFVCGAKGNVITFIKNLFNIDFYEVVKKLDVDFNLNLLNKRKLTLTQYRKMQQESKKKLQQNKLKELSLQYTKYGYRQLVKFRLWLLEQEDSKLKVSDLAYVDRLMSKLIDRNSIMNFDAHAIIRSLKSRYENQEELE